MKITKYIKKFASKLFSKLVIMGLIILFQIGWVIMLVYHASERNSIFNMCLNIVAVAFALYVVNRDMKPYNKLSWIFLILCFPMVGCPCYWLFGRPDLVRWTRKRMRIVEERIKPYREEDKELSKKFKEEDIDGYKQSHYITNCAGYPLYKEGETTYFKCGEDMFDVMLNDLRNAKKYIFLEYFIVKQGYMFDTILSILVEKVRQGVEVRFIYDDVGCIGTVPPSFYKMMREKGIQCERFNPFRPFLSVIMNNRDHRKIMVIDGKIAYTGGINLSDEYINKHERFGYWKDSAIRVTGNGVWSFTTMFLEMWDYITNTVEDCLQYKVDSVESNVKSGLIQPYSDTPLDHETVGENIYLNMIQQAKEYVYIFTPYLIIGPEMVTALVNTAKSGVDVRIVTPGIPDKKMVFMLTQSHYETLIRGGVKIYEYSRGFLHAKCFVCDDKYAVVGTVNLDFRSLYLHFENGVVLYHSDAVMDVKRDMKETFENSREISIDFCESRNIVVRLISGILHLFAPLL